MEDLEHVLVHKGGTAIVFLLDLLCRDNSDTLFYLSDKTSMGK